MRILFICATGGSGRQQLGGAERFLMETLPALAQADTVAAVVPHGAVADALAEAGVEIIYAGPTGRIDWGYRAAIAKAIQQWRPDVVSAHLLSSAMHVRSLGRGRLGGAALVVTLHNSMRQYVDASRGRQRLRARANLLLDRVQRTIHPHRSIAVSPFEEAELLRVRPRRPVVRIDNPLPSSYGRRSYARDAERIALGLPLDRPIVAFVGRLETEKGADLLGDISRSLANSALVVTAGEGTITPPSPIVNLGRVADPERVWAIADVVIVPSRVESFGRVALEAVAAGVPIVHTGSGGLKNLLSPAEGVLTFETPLYADAFASRVRFILNDGMSDPGAVDELRRWYRDTYSFDRKVDEWRAGLTP